MKPDEREKQKMKNHVEDWTSYSYNYNNGFEDNHLDNYHRKNKKYISIPHYNSRPIKEDDYQTVVQPYTYNFPNLPIANELRVYNETSVGIYKPSIDSKEIIDKHMPSTDVKAQSPPSQYKIYENIDEESPNNIQFQQFHKEGYRHGMKTEIDHVIHKNLKDFYDNENEEENYTNNFFEDENFNPYNTLNNNEKYDKEIGLEQREGKQRFDKRFIVARLVIR
jgi:hypothetical protein